MLAFSLLLGACGGGGGNSISTVPSAGDDPRISGGDTQTAFRQTRTQATDVLTPGSRLLPRVFQEDDDVVFGSVAQARTVGLADVSGVDTSFTGDRFTLEIKRRDGSNIRLDTDRDDVSIVTEYSPSQNPVTNRPALDGYMAQSSASRLTVAGASVEWSSTDYSDYTAGGYWLHLDTVSQGVEVGAFMDGPDYESAVNLPVTGTATYDGRAAGIYLTKYGADVDGPIGTLEAGEYGGDLSLVADFGVSTISGRINNIDLFGSYQITPNGNVYYAGYGYTASDYELVFGATPINQNGQFTGSNVRLTHPGLNITTSGTWAGRFSTVDDSAGNPRAVVGTHKGYTETPGGTVGIFVGAHYGATERFD